MQTGTLVMVVVHGTNGKTVVRPAKYLNLRWHGLQVVRDVETNAKMLVEPTNIHAVPKKEDSHA